MGIIIYLTNNFPQMSISKAIAVVALVSGTQAKLGPNVGLVEHHTTQIQCKEIDGYVKDCQEGLYELMGYLGDVTEGFKRSKDASIKPLADSLADQFHAFDQPSGYYLEPFVAPKGQWKKYVSTVNKLRLAVKASRDQLSQELTNSLCSQRSAESKPNGQRRRWRKRKTWKWRTSKLCNSEFTFRGIYNNDL